MYRSTKKVSFVFAAFHEYTFLQELFLDLSFLPSLENFWHKPLIQFCGNFIGIISGREKKVQSDDGSILLATDNGCTR